MKISGREGDILQFVMLLLYAMHYYSYRMLLKSFLLPYIYDNTTSLGMKKLRYREVK